MSLTNRLFSDAFRDLQVAMNTFDEAFGPRSLQVSKNTRYPSSDVVETPDAYELTSELPGYEKENLKLEWTDNHTLVLSGSVKKETSSGSANGTTEEPKYLFRERSSSSFSRSFSFHENVDAGKISAKFENGLLKVTIPKKPESKPRLIKL